MRSRAASLCIGVLLTACVSNFSEPRTSDAISCDPVQWTHSDFPYAELTTHWSAITTPDGSLSFAYPELGKIVIDDGFVPQIFVYSSEAEADANLAATFKKVQGELTDEIIEGGMYPCTSSKQEVLVDGVFQTMVHSTAGPMGGVDHLIVFLPGDDFYWHISLPAYGPYYSALSEALLTTIKFPEGEK